MLILKTIMGTDIGTKTKSPVGVWKQVKRDGGRRARGLIWSLFVSGRFCDLGEGPAERVFPVLVLVGRREIPTYLVYIPSHSTLSFTPSFRPSIHPLPHPPSPPKNLHQPDQPSPGGGNMTVSGIQETGSEGVSGSGSGSGMGNGGNGGSM